MLHMVTFTINIPPMLAYIPYMDPMGWNMGSDHSWSYRVSKGDLIAEEMSTRDSTTEGIFFSKKY